MLVRRTLAALAMAALTAGATATTASAGAPEGMPAAAYRALQLRSEALNDLHGLSPDAVNALVIRSEALNRSVR